MTVKVDSIVRALLVVAMAVVLAGCAQGTPQAGEGGPDSTTEGTATTEEIHLTSPVTVTDREPSGQWNVTEGPTWLEMYDGGTNEKMEFEDVTVIYQYFDVRENDISTGEYDYPDILHAALSDGTEGDINDPDVVKDLWHRVIYMRLSPDLVMADSDALYTNELVFSWDDGRIQTFAFKGHTALSVDGVLFPIIEDSRTGAEVFNGPIAVSRLENDKYPDTVFDIARMVIEDGLGKRRVLLIKSGSTTMKYSSDSFDWDAAGDGTVETYNVKSVKESDGSQSWVRIKAADMGDPPSCTIEGAERLYVVEKMSDDEGYPYLEITYQPEGSEERATCTIRMENDELVVSYQ